MSSLSQVSVPFSATNADAQMLRLLPLAGLHADIEFASRQDATEAGCRVFRLDGNFESGGVWAGVDQLVEAAYLGLLKIGECSIVEEHDYELYMALPKYRDRIIPRHLCLTDTATTIEKTRFYPMERAYRLVHGLVGIVLQWKRALRDRMLWVVIVHNFDHTQFLATRFFGELVRRAAHGREIDVIVETGSDRSDVARRLPGLRAIHAAPWISGLVSNVAGQPPIDDLRARTIEAEIADGSETILEQECHKLLRYHQSNGDGLAKARIAFKVLPLYNRRGYYHEAKSFIDTIIPYFDRLVGDEEFRRMNSVSEMNSCLVATGDAARALCIVEELAVPYITRPHLLANMNYIQAMHHLRYAEGKAIDLAEQFILQAVDNVRAVEVGPEASERLFLAAFIDNALAFLRVRQKRHQEALDLCQDAYQSVTRGLGEDRHLLHRSVLQYNMAQVYVILARHEEALQCYNNAILLDPYYAEYHAEVGNILQQLDRYPEAIDAYEEAIRYSSPYPEVYFNKAVCHAREEQWPDALTCSGISLELHPDQPELYAARAEIFVELGKGDEALAEYDSAIALAPGAIAMRVNRAVLHFNQGSYDLALEDMNYVIAHDALEAGHYENRGAIYEAIDRHDLYLRDLELAERCKEPA